MKHTRVAALLLVALLTACDAGGPGATVASGEAKPEVDKRMADAVKSRKATLVVLKDNFVPLALMAAGRIEYDAAAAQRYADRLPVLVGMLEERFTLDTRGSGVETEALDVIWEEMDAFKGKIADAQAAADTLAVVAGDESQFKDAATAMRSACGSCHDDFRVDDD